MIKYPMFGQDSIPHKTSQIFSFIGTGIFWLIFLICSLCIKPQNKKPKYETVQIVLASTPEAKKEEVAKAEAAEKAPEPVQEVTAPQPAPAAKSAQKPVEKASESKTAPKPAPKSEPKKTEAPKSAPKSAAKPATAPAKVAEPVYARDYSEDFDFDNNATSKTSQTFNWDNFDDSSDVPESSTSSNVVKTSNSFEADNSVNNNYSNNSVSSTSSNSKSQSNSTSKSTSDALSSISNSAASKNVGSVSKNGSDTNANSDFTFKNGEPRSLLSPEKPFIEISKENEEWITVNDIQVTFTVTEQGSVVRLSIQTTPNQPPFILEEVRDQVGKWIFSKGSSQVQAVFPWHIKRE